MVALCVVKYEKCRGFVVAKNYRTLYAKNRRFLTKKAVFLVRVTGLEPAAS